MLTVFKPVIEQPLKPVARVLQHINPNLISLLGLVFPVLFFWAVMQEQYAWALVAFVFNGVDLLDGMVARLSGNVTAFGGFLDSTIDRFADFTVIAVFGFAGLVGWNIILPLLMLTYLISYMRSRTELAAKGKLTASVGIIERTERLLLVFIGLLLYAVFPNTQVGGQNVLGLTCLLLIALSVITVAQRTAFAYQKLKDF
ncbi:MAG TPA: CDP-alcohol phosphatidyltransferase family protein [Candidatus Saccharimonadales bacterium]|nr:CDP-alcohol phosphatidyltransferase family protein [Candidatus Saccharimonadales bacterium]